MNYDFQDNKTIGNYVPSKAEIRAAKLAKRRADRKAADDAIIEAAVGWIEGIRFNGGRKMKIFLWRIQLSNNVPRPIISQWLREHKYEYLGSRIGWQKNNYK